MKTFWFLLGWAVLVSPLSGMAQVGVTPPVERVFDQNGPVSTPKSGSPVQPARPVAPQKGTRQDAPPAKTNWMVAPEKAPHYDGLEVSIISGTAVRRLATINNRTFVAGESMSVKVGNEKINVQCVEIRERSVIVKVDGEDKPRELRLPPWR